MASTLFDRAAERIAHHTGFESLAARGTLRLALKRAGVEARTLTLAQLRAVLERIMDSELERRGVREAKTICARVLADVNRSVGAAESQVESQVDDVFRRLGGD